jgi:hypothetical protein
MITPDLGAAACGLTATLFFRRWLNKGTWETAFWCGLWLGLAELTKTTWLFLFPLWTVLWWAKGIAGWTARILQRSGLGAAEADRVEPATPLSETDAHRPVPPGAERRRDGEYSRYDRKNRRRPPFLQLASIVLVALYVLNFGYGFEGTCMRLGDFHFLSAALAGDTGKSSPAARNRFEGTWLGRLPLPVPANFVQGIDHIKWEFERGMASYLRGEWKHGGWWYYYLYAAMVKVPVGLLVLGSVTLVVTGRQLWRARQQGELAPAMFDDLVLLAPGVCVLVLVSSQTGFNHHFRYVLPALPFFFIWIGKLGRWFEGPSQAGQLLVLSMVGWAVASSLWVYPHSLSYFNEIAGGPAHGNRHLHNSNVDWGQDLVYLREWLERHPDVKRIGVAPYHWVDLHTMGLPSFKPNRWPPRDWNRTEGDEQIGPQPGWFAISMNHLVGEPAKSHWGKTSEEYPDDPSRSYFTHFAPVDRIGYSMNIYHVSLAEANQLRQKLGLKPLPADWQPAGPAAGHNQP